MLLTTTLAAAMALAPAMQTDGDGQETAAAEQSVEATSEAAAEAGYDDEQRVRCRYEHFVNTRIPQRVCRTVAEWDRIAEANREANANNRRNTGARGESGAAYGAESTGGF